MLDPEISYIRLHKTNELQNFQLRSIHQQSGKHKIAEMLFVQIGILSCHDLNFLTVDRRLLNDILHRKHHHHDFI